MPTTPIHGWSTPDGSEQPQVHLDMESLADDIDADVPVYSASAPAHRIGRIWVNATTKAPLISDGTVWMPLAIFNIIGENGGSGTAMPANSLPFVQAFPVAATTNGAGLLPVTTFPVPFAAPPIVIPSSVAGSAAAPVVQSGWPTATQVQLVIPSVVSAAVRVHVVAIGWK